MSAMDRKRLNWMERDRGNRFWGRGLKGGWDLWVGTDGKGKMKNFKTIRQAVDAAIKTEK